MNQEQTLYDRIGGTETIENLLVRFYERVVDDAELAPFFKDSSMDKVRAMQQEFIGAALGGPIEYSGIALSHVHSGLGITRKHFGLFVGHLLVVLKDLGISEADAATIIESLNMYVDDIVGGTGESE